MVKQSINLKNYLMSNFPNPKYKNISLIYLYSLDNELYKSLVAKDKIASEAVDFFAAKSRDVKQIRSTSEVLRNMGYGSLIDKYLKEQEAIQQKKLEEERQKEEERLRKKEEEKQRRKEKAKQKKLEQKLKQLELLEKEKAARLKRKQEFQDYLAKKQKEEEEQLKKSLAPQPVTDRYCLDDDTKMNLSSTVTLRTKKEMPVYRCPECEKSYMFTDGENFIREDYTPCYVYGKNIPVKCYACNSKLILTDEYVWGKFGKANLRYCAKCRLFHVPFNMYEESEQEWRPRNAIELKKFENEFNSKSSNTFKTFQVKSEPEYTPDKPIWVQKQENKERELFRLRSMYFPPKSQSKCYVFRQTVPLYCKDCSKSLLSAFGGDMGYCVDCNIYHISYKDFKKESGKWAVLNRKSVQTWQKEEDNKIKNSPLTKFKNMYPMVSPKMILGMHQAMIVDESVSTEQTKETTIAFKDFVIRRSVFKCKNAGHRLQNVTGIVKVMNQKGEIEDVYIPAGYCPNCDRYIIMESTYYALKDKGIILCRVSDEKSYLNLNGDYDFDSSNMAQKSILKQCGYSVSENSYLTSDGRKKLLCMIIDNGILRSSEVISYLDWFIRMRDGQYNLRNAIEKWRSDLDFIREKYSESWDQYRVSGIRR